MAGWLYVKSIAMSFSLVQFWKSSSYRNITRSISSCVIYRFFSNGTALAGAAISPAASTSTAASISSAASISPAGTLSSEALSSTAGLPYSSVPTSIAFTGYS